jgi:hypothetical protein
MQAIIGAKDPGFRPIGSRLRLFEQAQDYLKVRAKSLHHIN